MSANIHSHLLSTISDEIIPTKAPASSGDDNSFITNTCGGNIQIPQDGDTVITSPNYPNEYNNSVTCEWLVMGNAGRRFRMTFEFFELENG